MKPYKVLLISIVVFGLLIGGIFTLQTRAQTVTADVSATPFYYSEEDPIPEELRVTIKLPKPLKHEDIIPESIRVGGVVGIKPVPDWPKVKKNFFAFKISGWELMYGYVYPIIWHMVPPTPGSDVDIDVPVTGELIDGTLFEGSFTYTVKIYKPDLDNPPPP